MREPHRARARRAGRRRLLERRLPLDHRPRRACSSACTPRSGPAARLVAQCGGKGNIDALPAAGRRGRRRAALRRAHERLRGPLELRRARRTTEARLRRAGFDEVRCWLAALAGDARTTRSSSPAPSASATTSRRCPRSCASRSRRRWSAARAIRWCSSTSGSTSSRATAAALRVFPRLRRVKRQRVSRNARVLIALVISRSRPPRSCPAPQAPGRRPPRRPSIRGCRPSRPAASARPTSSTRTRGSTYIGQAAHCASTGAATDTDGCLAASLPLGTPVEVTGASPARDARLQLVADDAGERRVERRTPAPTTTSRSSSSTRPTSARSTRRCPASAGPPAWAEPRRPATTSTPTATRRCASASRS